MSEKKKWKKRRDGLDSFEDESAGIPVFVQVAIVLGVITGLIYFGIDAFKSRKGREEAVAKVSNLGEVETSNEALNGSVRPTESIEALLKDEQESPACVPMEAAIQEDPDSLNPQLDGWETEHLNDQAGAQLKALGYGLIEGKGLEEIEKLFVDECSSTELRPTSDNESVAFDEGQIRVVRQKPVQASEGSINFNHKGKVAVFDALQDMFQTFKSCKDVQSKFKIVRVDSTDDSLTTEQFVDFHGHSESGVVEQHATWRTKWIPQANRRAPLISSIELIEFEESSSSTGGSLFSDCTKSVFENETNIFEQQLNVGIPGWVRRLENYLKVFQFGHNGLAIGDVNNDGLDDLFLCQTGALPNRLFLHQSDGRLKDVSAAAGVDFLDDTRAALFVDLDNDGDQDLVLAMGSGLLLMANDGSGKFELKESLPHQGGFSLAAADYDKDGQLDLYVCMYFAPKMKADDLPIPMPLYDAKNGGANVLLRNEGGWKFTEVTKESGLDADNSRFSYAAVWEDYDNDGDLDLFVANDFGRNNLYRNDLSDEKGKFSEVTEEVGMLDNTFGMSAASADFNRDGWVDFYKANMFSSAGSRVTRQAKFMAKASADHKQRFQHLARGNTLFENENGKFRDTSVERGVTMGRWSWGSIFMDFNNDGWEDIFVANGFVTGQIPDDL